MTTLPVFAIPLILLGCGPGDPPAAGDPNFVVVKDDDVEMNAAMARARQTLDEFLRAFSDRKPGRDTYQVKGRFEEAGQVEFIWLDEIRYEGGRFHGKIGNDPVYIKKFKYEDACSISRGEVVDWMYVDGGRLVGGHTIRVLRKRLPEAERKEMERQLPYKVD